MSSDDFSNGLQLIQDNKKHQAAGELATLGLVKIVAALSSMQSDSIGNISHL